MKIKPGASIQGLDIRMRKVLIAVEKVWREHGQESVITSGNENVAHSAGSLHPYGLALDFRTRYFGRPDQKLIVDELRLKLGNKFDVVLEVDHIHVEYDAK